ncbi:MAG: serine/threonine-protein kinase [Pseudomonadota bacterium]
MSSAEADLAPGTRFESRNGLRSGVVEQLLGAGGQGAVYQVRYEGAPFALKWYHPYYVQIDTSLHDRLTQAVARGAPDARFLWPLELVNIPGEQSFGYLMALRDANYVGMRDLIAPPPQRVELSLAQRTQVCEHIAHCFLQLHSRGFCYQDINFGNIFLHPERADILICDNDNVNVDGADASIYGTRKFMAPEVVRREVLPSTNTDLFSMAVLFFYILFGWHPLDGRREADVRMMNAEAEMSLYGTEPLFIFDPENNANGPVSPMHDAILYRWRSLSDTLRALFIRSFTAGLFSPKDRVLEWEWRAAFADSSRRVFACVHCGYENLVGLESGDTLTPAACGYCGTAPGAPAVMVSNRALLALTPGSELSEDQLLEGGAAVVSIARIDAHPEQANILGLRNLSAETWRAEVPGFSATPIEPGKTIRLLHGLKLDMAGTSVRIVNPKDAPAHE